MAKITERFRSLGHSTWTFLNSGFGLWLLSTIAVGIFTAVYTDAQSCRKDFEELSERYEKSSNEVWARFSRFAHALQRNADWKEEALMPFLNDNAFRREFQGWGYMDVEFEAHSVLKEIKSKT